MSQIQNGRIFISYCHAGRGPEWKAALLHALHIFEQHHLLDVWQDGRIRASSYWEDDIDQAMRSAQLAVVLLTKEALESEYIVGTEFAVLSERQQEGNLPVFPVVCEECDWRAYRWLRATQSPNKSNPIALEPPAAQERIFRRLATDIAEELSRVALGELPKPQESLAADHIYVDKFPLTQGSSLRKEKLIGREQELALLDLAFAQPHTSIVSLVAWGGVGKTMLVQEWLKRLEREGWFGARRVYAWNFYSQGTSEDRQASEDSFLTHALAWFGVECEPTLSPWDKGRLLADAVASERTLLVLDGIEPLQYPPGPMGGKLRAPGVQSLLKQLARKTNDTQHRGLCLVTTRERLTDLVDFERRPHAAWGSVLHVELGNLTEEAGGALLHHAGANRAGAAEIKPDDNELIAASREVGGHALTLNLLGRFLARAHGGDIRRRNLVKFEEADRTVQGGTTFKMLAAFEEWFNRGSDLYKHQLAALSMLGLFDQPADSRCMTVLREPPAIAGLTDRLFMRTVDTATGEATVQPLVEEDWNNATYSLADFGLVVALDDSAGHEALLDCHPLIREYFSEKVKARNPDSWRSAHHRLYEYLSLNTDYQPDAFDQMLPLFQAIAHGCKAGLHSAMCDLYYKRILREDREYSWKEVGTIGLDMATISLFFEIPWSKPYSTLPAADQAWVMNQASLYLRNLGRIVESMEPILKSIHVFEKMRKWENAAISSSNLSDGELTTGRIPDAYRSAEIGLPFAERAADDYWIATLFNDLGTASHQFGRLGEASEHFAKSEAAIARCVHLRTISYGLMNFHYCDFLLAPLERIAWEQVLTSDYRGPIERLTDVLSDVQRRTENTLSRNEYNNLVLAAAMGHLTISRSELYRSLIVENNRRQLSSVHSHLDTSMRGLSSVNVQQWIVCGLLTRAWLRVTEGDLSEGRDDLNEAWDIAERGPMKLYLADIHLYRARLFFREKHYAWKSPEDDLLAAEALISECRYHRRDEELADAKRAILGEGRRDVS